MTDRNLDTRLQVIDIVDELVHALTRFHIPDYPEANKAVQSLLQLKQKWQREELGKILIRHQENLLSYTDDIESDDLVIYLNDRIKELGDK